VKPGPDAGKFLSNVDWSNTKAYGIGLGAIYLNLRDREGNGIVEKHDSSTVATEIVERLSGLEDSENSQVAIRSVATCEDLYQGPYVDLAPDLLINFAPGYRVSWDTPLGGIPDGIFEDNRKKWSGDHVIDAELAPGILLLNRPLRNNNATLIDLAPTILEALGAPVDPELEGTSLL